MRAFSSPHNGALTRECTAHSLARSLDWVRANEAAQMNEARDMRYGQFGVARGQVPESI